MAKNIEENVEVTEEQQPVVKTTKKTAAAEQNSEIEALKAQVELLMKMITTNAAVQTASAPATQVNDEIKIVHLVERGPGLSTYVKLSNYELILTKFAEERVLTRQQFEELLGKHRKWFDEGMLTIAAGYETEARRYGLKTAKDYPMNSEFVSKLGNLNMSDIETMYERLPESGKDFLLSYWTRKAVVENDPKFKDTRKIEMLNRLSNGALENVMLELKKSK